MNISTHPDASMDKIEAVDRSPAEKTGSWRSAWYNGIMKASIRSNSGNKELSIDLSIACEYAHEDGYKAQVRILGEHWDGDHTHPLALEFNGIWLRKRALIELRDQVSEWINQPLRELASSELIADFELGTLSVFRLKFGPREDTIPSRMPVLTAEVKVGNVQAEIHFVADQSCLRLFVDELSEALKD